MSVNASSCEGVLDTKINIPHYKDIKNIIIPQNPFFKVKRL